jgi:hypothetical protein
METPEPPPPPLCFVLMPFGTKKDAAGRVTNFDSVYRQVIAPGVKQAGLDPIRADEEKIGGTIQKPMFERLMLCPYAVADITGANPNVFYELGIRHALRPASTAIVFLEGTVIPFDIALVRGIAYRTDGAGEPLEPESGAAAIAAQLGTARNTLHDDSPLFQLIDDLPHLPIDHAKTDIFRKQVEYSQKYKERLGAARDEGAAALKRIADEPALKNLNEVEAGIIVDLFLSLRDVKAYPAMIELYERMPEPLKRAKLMREQYGFALNREERFEKAEQVLKQVIDEFGPSSETNGLLGRVYKDRWEKAKAAREPAAPALLRRAIDTYVQGFETDWRDHYPGVNALTLMEQLNKPDPRKAKMLPVVTYSVNRKIATNADYWDYATLLELAVLGNDRDAAGECLAEATSVKAEAWMLETTKRNLGLIRKARTTRGEDAAWIELIENEVQHTADALKPPAKA